MVFLEVFDVDAPHHPHYSAQMATNWPVPNAWYALSMTLPEWAPLFAIHHLARRPPRFWPKLASNLALILVGDVAPVVTLTLAEDV